MDSFDQLSASEKERFLKLSEQFVKFPLSFSIPVHFGDYQNDAMVAKINNGTGTLLKLDDRKFCITNWHVLNEYRQRQTSEGGITFQIGNVGINPESILVSESKHYDLAVLDIGRFTDSEIASDGEVPTQFFEASDWPPPLPRCGQFVMFGGYPGYWREPTGRRELRFDTASSGGAEVHDARDDNIVCQLQLEKCIRHSYVEGRNGLGPLTGLSGGPVLMERRSAGGISTFELVGIIYEYSESIDALYSRPLSLLSREGVICAPPLA